MSDNDEKDRQDAENNPEEPAEESKPAPRKKASRDRNQRVREQAARKLETSKKDPEAKSARPAGAGLDAGEIMDDALARGFAAFIKWIKTNRRGIEIGVAVAILGGIGYATWDWYSAKRHGAASGALYQAVRNEQGIVKPAGTEEPEAKDEEESRFDTRARFATYDARRDDTLAAYRKAATDYGNTGAGMLARLGEAGVLLDKHDYDGALSAANAVLASELSKADVDVRMSARELVGMALQGKGDLDGAKTAFEDMAASDTAFYKDLGEYHAARILFAKGNKGDATERLKKLRDKLATAAPSSGEPTPQSEFLKEQVDVLLRAIDPSLAPAQGGGSASQLSPDQLKRLQEEIQRLGGGQPPGAPNEPAPAPGNTP